MIHVLTNEMVRFEIDGSTWNATRYINGADGVTQLVTVVEDAAGAKIAEFADVHAIWNDKGELIKPDDNN